MGGDETGRDAKQDGSRSSIEQWIAACKDGSSEGFGRIVDACRDYLLLIANQDLAPELRPKIGASDLVQETLVLAQKNLSEFRGESEAELLAWLRTILRNHLLDVTRKYKQAEKRDIGRERSLHAPDSQGASMDVAAGRQTPRSNAIAGEEAELLIAAMAQLPDDARQVIQLRSWEQLSFAEIGERTNRSAEAARKVWSRAVERLALQLNGDESDECSE